MAERLRWVSIEVTIDTNKRTITTSYDSRLEELPELVQAVVDELVEGVL